MLKISQRLLSVANEIGKVDSVADIGTDHGKLIIYALENNFAKRAFAVDVSSKSLQKARDAVIEYGLEDKVKFFHGDGLEPLTEIPDVTVIAGIGGNETVNILKNATIDTKYIFVPHNDAHILRQYLCESGFEILKDYIIKDGKFYAVLVAVKGNTEYNSAQIWFGADKPHTDYFEERIRDRKSKIEKLLCDKCIVSNRLQPELQEEYREILKWLK